VSAPANAIHVVRPGLLTTVQDLGRWGHQATGVAVAGPMDTFSHRVANALVGNDGSAATLEITLIGPELQFERACSIALAGADFDVACAGRPIPMGMSIWLDDGARLQFGRCRAGARAYLAVEGGIHTPPVLGSRATHLVSGMGGYEGRALLASDVLPIDVGRSPGPARRAPGSMLPTDGRVRLRVVPGAQAEWFAADAWRVLSSTSFRVSPRSNRMGYRLEGPQLLRQKSEEPISEPLTFGAIQVPAAGEPILLMADRPTAGGYPKIGCVIAADLPIAGQLKPGDFIEFDVCGRQQAAAALIARERPLLRLADQRRS
jgi:antagonist of KipI